MNDFWNNIVRYPRFFVSSLFGLVLIILAPLRNLVKTKKFRILVPISCILFVVSLYKILESMTGF